MKRTELIAKVKALDFPAGEYWLLTGGAMVLYGLKEETSDIDLGCSHALAETLIAQGYPDKIMPDGTRRIGYSEEVELFEEWLYDKVVQIEGIPVISLDGLIAMKRALGRKKDLRDIALIEQFREEHSVQ